MRRPVPVKWEIFILSNCRKSFEANRTTDLNVRLQLTGSFRTVTGQPAEFSIPQCDLFPDGLTLVWSGSKLTWRIPELERKSKEPAKQ